MFFVDINRVGLSSGGGLLLFEKTAGVGVRESAWKKTIFLETLIKERAEAN